MTWLRIALPLGALVVILSLILLWQREAARADRVTVELSVTNDALARSQVRIADLQREAQEKLTDDTAIDKAKEELTDAIKSVPAGTAPGAATLAAGCIRLRRAGLTASADYKRVCGGR